MSLPAEVEAALKDLKRARLLVKQAKERLVAELPESVASEIHYNGAHAQVSAEYAPVFDALMAEVVK